ncbi:MAG TPA: ferrochelatase [Candidatus Saccharimonadales bacterium]|nr:ferrochelatase [Candidatus Saccharimonadales bacterium]
MEVSKKIKQEKIGVILMTYGSPKSIAAVPKYLKNIYGGKDASADVIKEFKRRYSLIGGSPLIKITKNQAKSLEKELNKKNPKDLKFKVSAGMRFSEPFIGEVIPKLAKGVNLIIGVIMSPQYSPIIMSGYRKELESAVESLRRNDLELKIATDWHLQPYFIKALAKKVTLSLNKNSKKVRSSVPVLFSAHSMPKRVIEKEPDYINHLKETATAVASEVGLPKDRWMFCYQSAGHTPEEWLKPDFADVMPELQKKGIKHVLIAPVQFIADHLEILYDVGIGAKEQAEQHGIVFSRTDSLNVSPLFIRALADVVTGVMAKT